MGVMLTKKEYRRMILQHRATLPAEEIRSQGTRLISRLAEHPLLRDPTQLYLFCPMPGEPDLSPLARRCLEKGYPVGIPVLTGPETMSFRKIDSWSPKTWPSDRYGIPEPSDGPILEPPSPDSNTPLPVVLVPGLAFGLDGTRLGRGGGYYDRWLARFGDKILKIGVGFSWQTAASVPSESHDIRMDHLCTENGLTPISH